MNDKNNIDNEIITEALPAQNTFFTIDPYSSINDYNEAINALENNGISYSEWISLM